jgi:protoporphyrinogen oxidase
MLVNIDQVRHPLNGFGLLTPAKERLSSLGVFFSSSLFEGRAPNGHVALNVFLGGSRNPALCTHGRDEVLRAAIDSAVRDRLWIDEERDAAVGTIVARTVFSRQLFRRILTITGTSMHWQLRLSLI